MEHFDRFVVKPRDGCGTQAIKRFGSLNDARAELEDNVYYLHAEVDYRFSEDVLEAIHNGVPMVVVLDVELYRDRSYVWDEEVASLEQRYELQYHALSEQYLVSNLNSGEAHTSLTLHSALYGLRDVDRLPVIDRHLLEKGKKSQQII